MKDTAATVQCFCIVAGSDVFIAAQLVWPAFDFDLPRTSF